MRRLLFIAAAVAALAGCKPAQIALSVAPAFYPSALAHDPADDRFFVASYATGEIAIVRRDGARIGTVPLARVSGRGARGEGNGTVAPARLDVPLARVSGRGARGEGSTPAPIVQLAYEPRERRLWALTPDAVELIDFEPGPARRTAIAAPAPGGRFVDLVADGEGRAFVLDASRREIAAVDAHRRSARVVAQLPVAPSETHAMSAAPRCAGGAAHDEGALALLPDRSALLAATDGALWRIDLRTSAVDAVHLDVPLPHVSQLVPLGADATAHHLAVLRGCANEVVTLHLARDARRGIIDAGTRARFDTPWRGVHDGRDLVVLLGRLRHHPDFGGDGRPNLPARLAAYVVVAPGERPTVAEVR